jgi:hypothetical protein
MMREITSRYIDTALAPRVIAEIRARASAGAYDTLTTVATFARGITQDLRRFDKHFSIFPATATGQPQVPGAARDNFGIKRIERLDGNVGYLRFDVFSLDSSGGASVLRSALRALARTDALILDPSAERRWQRRARSAAFFDVRGRSAESDSRSVQTNRFGIRLDSSHDGGANRARYSIR